MNNLLGGGIQWILPPEAPQEDFIEGQLEWDGRHFGLYYERSLGYMRFAAGSRTDIQALVGALGVQHDDKT
ncbi:hypothetical protein [Ideonella sp.]|uniref:hypothetical protein n=1 Tax=Ideonella sp. TaxID=1929293 RepID=UPI0037C11405